MLTTKGLSAKSRTTRKSVPKGRVVRRIPIVGHSKRTKTSAAGAHQLVTVPGSQPDTVVLANGSTFVSRAGDSMLRLNAGDSLDDVKSAEPREQLEFDVLVVGGGPAGLSAAIQLKKLSKAKNIDLNVCLIDKGAQIGAHILSGNVFQPTYLNELIPDWQSRPSNPLKTKVTEDHFHLLTDTAAIPLPTPKTLHNDGNYIISLGKLCQFLAEEAEALGVDIFPGFAAAEVIYHSDGHVLGVATPNSGIDKKGTKTDGFTPGVEIRAKQTIFAEGARGSCSEEVIKNFTLRTDDQFQTYGIGIKEVWELAPEKHKEGAVFHTVGWPSPLDVYSGNFLYHAENNLAYLGTVIGLDYKNPYLSPYQELQKWKTHPFIKNMLEGGKAVGYGARALTEGGFQAIPDVTFPGGLIIGCSAGYMNVPKIKGSHNAMKSGMLAAEAIFGQVQTATDASKSPEEAVAELQGAEIGAYETIMEASPVHKELYAARNVRPAYQYGILPFFANAGLELFITKGNVPWTIPFHPGNDADTTELASKHTPIDYPKPDGKLTFNLLENLTRANVMHGDDQPAHLTFRSSNTNDGAEQRSYMQFAAPEQRFCPAGVYEYLPDTTKPSGMKLQINAQNCVHCKTCDIKTPSEFIKWTIPSAAEPQGPNYTSM